MSVAVTKALEDAGFVKYSQGIHCGGKSSGVFGFNARSNVAYGTFRPHLRPSPDVNFVALLIYYASKKVNSSLISL